MTYLLLVADPEENEWSIIAQSEDADSIIDDVGQHDPSLRIVINTETFITFDIKEHGDGRE